MPRLVIHTATGPTEVKTKDGSVWICRCGLTENEDGTCSGNHKKLKVADEDPNEIYEYGEDGKRHQLAEECCGDDCCKDEDHDNEDDDDEDDERDDTKEDETEEKQKGCCGGCGGCCREEK